jgi:opacity protein-like surface antigen
LTALFIGEEEMKKNIVGSVCGFFLLVIPVFSLAASGLYGSVNAGVSMATDSDVSWVEDGSSGTETWEYDSGYIVSGAVGYMIEKYRVEGEVIYQANDVDTVDGLSISPIAIDTNALSFLVSGYLDFDTGSIMTPYITAGIGASRVEADIMGLLKFDDTVLGYQLGVGVGFAMSETVSLDFRYRYLGAAEAEFNYNVEGSTGRSELDIASHNITAGLTMAF